MTRIALILASVLLAAGCGSIGEVGGGCEDATYHLAACMGDDVASAYATGTCNPDTAARLLAQDCNGLRNTLFNDSGKADCDIATPDSPARVLLIHTREDYMIAREARRLVLQDEKQ